MLLSALVMTSLTMTSLTAQNQEQKANQNKSDVNLNVDLVTIDAQVLRQKTERIAWRLTLNDFIVYEDGVRQKITNFSQDTLPLSVILLIDRRGYIDPFSEKIQSAVMETIRNFKPGDEVAVMSFSDKTVLFQPFQTDRKKTEEALNKLPYSNDMPANHCFNKALFDAAAYMRESGNPVGRRLIIMITGSARGINCKGPTAEQTTTEVLESGSTVCALMINNKVDQLGAAETAIQHGINDAAKIIGVGTVGVKSLVDETGGEYVSVKPDNSEFQFDTLVTRLRTRYAKGFVSSNAKHDGGYRKLKVEMSDTAEKREGKLIVKTRRGYIAAKDKKQ